MSFQALAKKFCYPGLNAEVQSCLGRTECMALVCEMWRFNFTISEDERGFASGTYIFY
jgi:hypothetical protein